MAHHSARTTLCTLWHFLGYNEYILEILKAREEFISDNTIAENSKKSIIKRGLVILSKGIFAISVQSN